MLVLDAEDLARFTPSLLTAVVSLTRAEAATLYQAWEHAVREESLEWLYVADVYVSKEGYFYFYSEKGMKSDFNIFSYLNSKCSSLAEDLNSLNTKAILGDGIGLPKNPLGYVAPVEPPKFPTITTPSVVAGGSTFEEFTPPVWGGGVSHVEGEYLEDDERTGLLSEDDSFPQTLQTAFELHVESTDAKLFIGRKEYTIGRSESADWRILGNKTISRFHAKIWVDADDKLMVLDTGSSNGVFVDAVRIGQTPVDVSRASVIIFGNAKVRNLGERQVAY